MPLSEKGNELKDAVNAGQYPSTMGARMEYKAFNNATDDYKIKLSRAGKRASFFVNQTDQRVHTRQLEGYTRFHGRMDFYLHWPVAVNTGMGESVDIS
jgi:hypothetical protein